MTLFKTKRIRIIASFRSKTQVPFFMLIKEIYREDGEMDIAVDMFNIWLPGQHKKFIKPLVNPHNLPEHKSYIIVSNDTDKMYLCWQEPVWGEDGYFWTWKDVVKELIACGYNTDEHPFLFNTKRKAKTHAKKIGLSRNYNLEKFVYYA